MRANLLDFCCALLCSNAFPGVQRGIEFQSRISFEDGDAPATLADKIVIIAGTCTQSNENNHSLGPTETKEHFSVCFI